MNNQFKTKVLASLVQKHHPLGENSPKHPKVLVVGCGNGVEASTISHVVGNRAVGIDLAQEYQFDRDAAEDADLVVADATEMPFADNSFDWIYSFHVLEHIPRYEKALAEMRRVLRPDGVCMIGTPNRGRLVGYWSSDGITWGKRILFNWVDWQKRIKGKFRNEFGAHAGFKSDELATILRSAFQDEVFDISVQYYRTIYTRQEKLVSVLDKSGASRFLFPAVYFVCYNRAKSC